MLKEFWYKWINSLTSILVVFGPFGFMHIIIPGPILAFHLSYQDGNKHYLPGQIFPLVAHLANAPNVELETK